MEISVEQLHVHRLKTSLYYFVKSYWNVLVPQPFIDMPWIKPFCDLTQLRIEMMGGAVKKETDWIVCAPPASSKSLITSVFSLPWAWINYPQLRFLGASHNATKANEFAAQSRRLIESEIYQRYFPLRLLDDQNTKGNFQNEFNGSRSATSVEANVLGSHYDWIVSDDLETPQDCKSETERIKINEYATSFLGSRQGNMPHSQIWYVMQRLHPQDLISYLDSVNGKYEKLILPAEQTSDVLPAEFNDYYQDGLLDNVRLTHEYLEGKRELQGNAHFNAQYLQSPGDNEDALIKESDFEIVSEEAFSELHKGEPFFAFADLAYTASKKNDPSAALMACKIGERAYITSLFHGWYEFPDLKKKLRSWLYENGYTGRSAIYIEPKGPGISMISDFKDSDINARPALNPTSSKDDRILSIQQRIQSRKVVLVRNSSNRKFLNEVCSKGGKHDDIKDALCMLVHELVKQGDGSFNVYIGGDQPVSFSKKNSVWGSDSLTNIKYSKLGNYGKGHDWETLDRTGGYRE